MTDLQQPERFSAGANIRAPFGFVIAGLMGVVVGIGLIIAGLVAPGAQSGAQIAVGAVLTVAFGAFSYVFPRWLKSRPTEIVVFSPAGAIDVRALRRPLPWSAITSVSDYPTPRGVMLVLETTPEALEAAEPKKRWAQTIRSVEYGISRSAFVIYPIGLTAKPNEMRHAAETFWRAYRARP